MTTKQKKEITQISKDFASGFEPKIPSINGSGWLIVDPLSAYLNMLGFKNSLKEISATETHPQVLVMEFGKFDVFIPAGLDLNGRNEKFVDFTNWMWL